MQRVIEPSYFMNSHYDLELAKTAALRKQDSVSSKHSIEQQQARQAVQTLLLMTPHLDSTARRHQIQALIYTHIVIIIKIIIII
jgi:hypothetical protein